MTCTLLLQEQGPHDIWNDPAMMLSIATAPARNLVAVPAALLRSRVAKDAEVLALRHQNAVLRRQIARVRYEPADRIWLAALSRLIPRARWREAFAVTPTTLLRWHREWETSAVAFFDQRMYEWSVMARPPLQKPGVSCDPTTDARFRSAR